MASTSGSVLSDLKQEFQDEVTFRNAVNVKELFSHRKEKTEKIFQKLAIAVQTCEEIAKYFKLRAQISEKTAAALKNIPKTFKKGEIG
jgi:hypothetical protein